jgi:proliferating cell nuclear antigen PCNA
MSYKYHIKYPNAWFHVLKFMNTLTENEVTLMMHSEGIDLTFQEGMHLSHSMTKFNQACFSHISCENAKLVHVSIVNLLHCFRMAGKNSSVIIQDNDGDKMDFVVVPHDKPKNIKKFSLSLMDIEFEQFEIPEGTPDVIISSSTADLMSTLSSLFDFSKSFKLDTLRIIAAQPDSIVFICEDQMNRCRQSYYPYSEEKSQEKLSISQQVVVSYSISYMQKYLSEASHLSSQLSLEFSLDNIIKMSHDVIDLESGIIIGHCANYLAPRLEQDNDNMSKEEIEKLVSEVKNDKYVESVVQSISQKPKTTKKRKTESSMLEEWIEGSDKKQKPTS